jgi:hypothetical protein
MALDKQTLNISFAKGIDNKTDPWQVQAGSMQDLQNSVFTKGGLLQKRNGFPAIPALPDSSYKSLTTFKDNLIATGTSMRALSREISSWLSKGTLTNASVGVTPAVRDNLSQQATDLAVAPNGLACLVFFDTGGNAWYQIIEADSGQIVVQKTGLPTNAKIPRVFQLGNYFVITFVIPAPKLQYIAIPYATPTTPGAATDIATDISGAKGAYDGVVAGGNLYLAYDVAAAGGTRARYIDSTLVQHGPVTASTFNSDIMSVTADTSGGSPIIWITIWSNPNGYSIALNSTLGSVLAATITINEANLENLTSFATAGILTILYEVFNTYPSGLDFNPLSPSTDYIKKLTCTQAGSVSAASVLIRSVALASKPFFLASTAQYYFLVMYQGFYQPTLFLIDQLGNVISKFSYSNASGSLTHNVAPIITAVQNTLSSVYVSSNQATVAYLFQDRLETNGKSVGVPFTPGIYNNLGVNLIRFTINPSTQCFAETGNDLHLTGGFLWMYDGSRAVEHGFHVWPEDLGLDQTVASGSLSAQQYYYVATYEWTDAQGNLHRSAPSVPCPITVAVNGSSVTVNVPTLRLTYKISPNPVTIRIYRWSTAQQNFFRLGAALQNDPTVDYLTYTDVSADSAIVNNLLLYTTGGVVENIAAPACSALTLYQSRLFLIDAEDPNRLWFSKQVIEATPVEMTDLFTLFISPTTTAQGPANAPKAIAPMDDKLIITKKSSLYYITGRGPDNTGANNDFSDPVFITGTVGCSNPHSIVFIPQGMMFQSDKGIWLLGRDLSTSYIGAPVENYNSDTVISALAIPGTNQVRFKMLSGATLMYDYYYNQWGTFTGIPGISSVLYQDLETYLASTGSVYQESPGTYLDGVSPVLLSFTTSWINMAGIQGYERAYFFYILGKYLSPHTLTIQIAYDYDPTIVQTVTITPDSAMTVEQWRVFLSRQKCESFQLTISENYDPSLGLPAGAGLTLSGLDLVIGAKSGYPRIPSSKYAG